MPDWSNLLEIGMTPAPPQRRAPFAALETDPFDRAAYQARGDRPMAGPPRVAGPSEMAQSAMILAPVPFRAIMSAPKAATAGLAAYNLLSGTDSAGGADDSDAVKQLQMNLRDGGLYRGPIDGKMGPATQKAQQDFIATKQLQAQQETASAARESAQAQRAAAEAAAAETQRQATEGETKARQREQGNERLTQMESDLPWYRRALRDYGSAIGTSAGLIAGPAVRAGVVRASNKLSELGANRAEQLFETSVRGTPARVARVNEFWRKGGGDVPFLPTPNANPGFAANPNASLPDALYQPNKTANRLTDIGVPAVFGAESAAGMYMGGHAEDELRRATEAASADPNEINIRALQAAKDKVAMFDAMTNFGRGGAGGYVGSSIKLQRSPSIPNMAPAETERLAIENVLRNPPKSRAVSAQNLAGTKAGSAKSMRKFDNQGNPINRGEDLSDILNSGPMRAPPGRLMQPEM